MKDDKTGLRQLSNVDLVTYALGHKRLTPLELELVMRLEQVIEQRREVLDKLPKLACATCPTFAHLMPRDLEGGFEELAGDTIWE
jgi:hypothetical protein